MPTRFKQMIHLNGNLMCAVAIRTTGPRAYYHDICEICVFPVDDFLHQYKEITPFDMYIRPRYIDRIDEENMMVKKDKMLDILKYGIDSFKAGDLLQDWFDKI